MKILFFLPVWEPAWQYGGPIRSTLEICRGMQLLGHEVKVITTTYGLSKKVGISPNREIIRSGVPVTYFSANQNLPFIFSTRLLNSLSSYMKWANIFHISAVWHPIGNLLQKKAITYGLPIIHSMRGALSPYSFSQSPLKKRIYYTYVERPMLQQASILHLTSFSEYNDSLRGSLSLSHSIPRVVIPNISNLGSTFSVNSADKLSFCRSHHLLPDIPTFLICGRIDHKKGLNFLPGIFQSLHTERWQVLIVGPDADGSTKNFLSELNNVCDPHRFRYLGFQQPENLKLIYSISDLLLMPSLDENFGNVPLEALNHGCKVLISNHVGISDFLTALPSSNSWGASLALDPFVWTSWLKEWLDNFSEPTRFCPSAEFSNLFSSDHISLRWSECYSQLL